MPDREPASAAAKNPQALAILLVEDADADAYLLEQMLVDAPNEIRFSVDHVKTLTTGESALRANHYDCVLLDLNLPDTQGVETVERLCSAGRQTAIVVMTGLDDEHAALEALKHGAQDYLVKGTQDPLQLVRVIQRAMERNRLLADLEMQRAQQYFLASHDSLTGLPNRQLFEEGARRALAQAERSGSQLAVLYLDLDGFKEVNDTHGHAVGDALLQQVAKKLSGVVRQGDIVARMGGDEFVVLLASISGRSEAEHVAQRMIDSVAATEEVDDKSVSISVSIGLAMYPGHGSSPEELCAHADSAMYEAKRAGRCRLATYSPSGSTTGLQPG